MVPQGGKSLLPKTLKKQLEIMASKADVIPHNNQFPSLVWTINHQLNSIINSC